MQGFRLRSLVLGIPILLMACGSAGISSDNATATLNRDVDRDTTDDFDLGIEQFSSSVIPPKETRFDMKYTLTITNRTDSPVTVTRVQLQSFGGGGDSELPVSHRSYKTTIAPKKSAKLDFWATLTLSGRQMPTLPSMLRASIDFKTDGDTRREAFTRNVGGKAAVTFTP